MKFDDPKTKALLTSVSGSAAIFRTVFIVYLIFVGYAGAIILSVTDRDLFLNADLTAPVLNVKFKTSYFFIVVPCIFLLLHLNLLTHMSVLVKKLNAYRVNVHSDSIMLGLLPDVLLIQSADKKHSSFFRAVFLKGIFVYGALMVLPVSILLFILGRFLAFQSDPITLFHVIVIIVDGLLLWYFFPNVKEIDTSQENGKHASKLANVVIPSIFLIVAVGVCSFLYFFDYTKGVRTLDVSGERLYLYSDISPNEACKKENRTLGANLKGRLYKGANLAGAILCHANLIDAQLQSANLFGVELQGANLVGAELQGANLVGAKLQGVSLIEAKLQGANLLVAELQSVYLARAELQGADLIGSELQSANLVGAELQGANLSGAKLQGANLSGAKLQGVNLGGSELQGANLFRAELQGAYSGSEVLDNIPRSFAKFNEVITLRIGKQGDLSGISNVTITNMAEYIQIITIKMGGFADNYRVSEFIHLMKESEANPFANISQAITGSYTKEDADQWIKEYKDAVCKIPKDIYEEKYEEKLDCP